MVTVTFSAIRVTNFRSIADSGELALGAVTLLIGANNSGKSSLIRAALMAHGGRGFSPRDIRYGCGAADVVFTLARPYPHAVSYPDEHSNLDSIDGLTLALRASPNGQVQANATWGAGSRSIGLLPTTRPDHTIVPILSRRKAASYDPNVRSEAGSDVALDDYSLASRLAGLTGTHDQAVRYADAMQRILGMSVSTYVGPQGPVPGLALAPDNGIDLERMGEGVRNAVTIASELADTAHPRLFLIEEPENDLHPRALTALLELIREEAGQGTHQFLVSTHSDVVLRELGSLPHAVIYNVASAAENNVPTTTYRPIEDAFDRREALASLGYDEPLPPGWIILEESSAQTFIEQALIPLFAPRLAAVKVVSSTGTGNLPSTVTALERMVLFAHLASKPTAWVLCDGDQSGLGAVRRLHESFKSWPADRFATLRKPRLEDYYPPRFEAQIAKVDSTGDRREKLKLKGALAGEVADWALKGDESVRVELEASAAEIIGHLQRIDRQLWPPRDPS